MGQKPVITIDDITRIELEERRPGAERGVLQEDASSQTVVYRIQPGSGVPTHLHSRVYDHFVEVKGELASTETAHWCSSPAVSAACRPACGTKSRIAVKPTKRFFWLPIRRTKVMISCRCRFARWIQRCRSRRGLERCRQAARARSLWLAGCRDRIGLWSVKIFQCGGELIAALHVEGFQNR
jgi:hypothetical protein